jgi:hypothetical protein
MNMNDNGQDDGTGMDGGGDVMGKIQALKDQLTAIVSAVDDIASSVSGEEQGEPQPGDETPPPDAGAAGMPPVPPVPGKKPLFGKRKPSGMMNALGIGG